MNIVAALQVIVMSMVFGYVLAGSPPIDGTVLMRLIRKEPLRPGKDRVGPAVLLVLIVSVGLIAFGRDVFIGITPYGTTTMGGFLESRAYTESYYVFLFPDRSKPLNYKVPAVIHAQMQWNGAIAVRTYRIQSAMHPEMGRLRFLEALEADYTLSESRIVEVVDTEGRRWGVQLTHEKAPQ